MSVVPARDVLRDGQQLRDGWLRVEAATRAAGGAEWGRAGGASRQALPGGRAPASGGLAAAAHALGLRWPCSADEAKAAFRRPAVECHPDRNRSDEVAANTRMAQVNVA